MRSLRKRFARPGSAPGTLRAPDQKRVDNVSIRVIDYDRDRLEERPITSVEELRRYRVADSVTWIDIVGLHDVVMLQELGAMFDLHSLALEDVLNTGQRPKHEDYEQHAFLVMKLLRLTAGANSAGPVLESEQISLFVGANFVITLQEVAGDVFDPLRERLRNGAGRIRQAGADYLAYALVDSLIDSFFPLLETYGERIEDLEDELIREPTPELLEQIHQVKKELLVLRRAAWPQRELIHGLERSESAVVTPATRPFLRDCYDHTIQIMDMIETYRDLAANLMELYLSNMSHKMNEVMKLLTVIASVFIPLTFLAGVYGMNFDRTAGPWNMPELGWRFGYPTFWVAIVVVGGGLLWLFRRKRWL